MINDETSKCEQSDEENEDDSNEPLIEKKQTKKKATNMKKGYYQLSEQDREGELFEANAYDEDEYEDDEDKDEEDEKTQLTKNFHKKKGRHSGSEKKSIRKKLFGTKGKHSLSKQNSTDDELGFGKIKIIVPRKKNKGKLIKYKLRKCIRNCMNLFSLCFLLCALIVVFVLLYFKRQYLNEFVKDHLSNPSSSVKRTLEEQSKHCDMLIVNNSFNVSLPKLIVGGPLRLLDVNMDGSGRLDILVPFATSIDQIKYSSILCPMYFNQSADPFEYGCGGGLLLLDGNTGQEIWRTYTEHETTSVSCVVDLDRDGINDCFLAGPKAQFYAISSQTGRVIWRLDEERLGELFHKNAPFFAPILLPKDLDGDQFPDILVMHGGDSRRKDKPEPASLLCVSSRSGQIISWAHTPDGQDSQVPPVLYYKNEKQDPKTVEIIYGTGSFTQPGSLWTINLDKFLAMNSLKDSINVYKDCCKGILTPPVLIDLNKDHIQDIVISLFNSTVAAFNGRTLVKLWHTKFGQNTEFYVPPAVGFFDGDDVPDFLVQYELGEGFPSSYYSEAQVLNGKNGKPMLGDSFKMLIGSRSAPITISVDTKSKPGDKRTANSSDQTIESFDLFLFWQITCDNEQQELKKLTSDQLDQFRYKLKFNSINDLKKTDFCKLRFGKRTVSRMNSVSFGNLVTTIYDSNERADKELQQIRRFNYTKIGADFLSKNPDQLLSYMSSVGQENGYAPNDDSNDDLFDFPNEKRNNYRDSGAFNNGNGFYMPGLNDKQSPDYSSSFKNRPADYSSFGQDRNGAFAGGLSLPNQQQSSFGLPNMNLPANLNQQASGNQFNDNPFNQNILGSLMNQLQQPKVPPPYNQGFDLNNLNNLNLLNGLNRNRFVKKKSSPDDVPTLEEMFKRRRYKRSADLAEAEFIHKIYSTGTNAN